MRTRFLLFFIFAAGLGLAGCTEVNGGGTIKEQGITTYMYGTHTIEINGTNYAIKSSQINLADYLDQYVTIHAEKVSGYPVDGGPELLEVISIN